MILLWILGILALLVCLVLWTRIRFHAAVEGGAVTLTVRVGPVTVFRYPAPPKREKKRKKKPRKEPKEEEEEEPRRRGLPSLEAIREAFRSLPGPLWRALVRLVKGFRIQPCRAALCLGGLEDPAAAAVRYGQANAALWTLMPVLERTLDIPDPDLRILVDFTAEETTLEGEAGVSARIGTLLGAGLCAGIPVLRYLVWYMRQGTNDSGEPSGEEEKDSEAAEDGAA